MALDPLVETIRECERRLCCPGCTPAEKIALGNKLFSAGLQLERQRDATEAFRVKGQRF